MRRGWPDSSGWVLPTVLAPSDSSILTTGGSLPASAGGCVVGGVVACDEDFSRGRSAGGGGGGRLAWSPRSIASPMAVPPSARSEEIASRTEERSVVGRARVWALAENDTRPTLNLAGMVSRKE